MAVYLLHFERKLAHAGHYIGYTKNIVQRLEEHGRGKGCKLMMEIRRQGIRWELARVWWEADGNFERKLKDTNSTRDYCPICMGDKVRDYKPRKMQEQQPDERQAEMNAVALQINQEKMDWLPF